MMFPLFSESNLYMHLTGMLYWYAYITGTRLQANMLYSQHLLFVIICTFFVAVSDAKKPVSNSGQSALISMCAAP